MYGTQFDTKLTKIKNMSSSVFISALLIKLVSNIHFHIILHWFLLHSDPQKQNTFTFIKSYSYSIHWVFSMGFLWVSSIRPIKTMSDISSYIDRSGQGFFVWRRFEKRSHVAEHVISLPFFRRLDCTQQAPEKLFLQLDKKVRHARRFRIQGENALLVWEWRGDAFTGCWLRFGKGLCSTWPDKKTTIQMEVPQWARSLGFLKHSLASFSWT